jgi:hypothetical protein
VPGSIEQLNVMVQGKAIVVRNNSVNTMTMIVFETNGKQCGSYSINKGNHVIQFPASFRGLYFLKFTGKDFMKITRINL